MGNAICMCDALHGGSNRLEAVRQTLALLAACALARANPGARFGMAGSMEHGFFCDALFDRPFGEDQLDALMVDIRTLAEELPNLERIEMAVPDAKALMAEGGQPFIAELLAELERQDGIRVTLARLGDIMMPVTGPLLERPAELPFDAVRLDRVSGAYWKGVDGNPMLTRVSGLAFADAPALDGFLLQRAEANRRDHRRLGRELDMFMISEKIGKGLPIFLPNGATVYRILERFIVDEEIRRGYQHVISPVLGRKELYETSGHLGHYHETMYPPMKLGDEEYYLRPMTCPHHFMIFANRPRSYRELPMRIAEISPLFRKEHSGALSGLVRVLMFHLSDAHIFIEPGQFKAEFRQVVELIQYVMKCLGISAQCSYRLSMRDAGSKRYIDDDASWTLSEGGLVEVCDEMRLDYTVAPGEAAFYGPKLDVQMRTSSGREETVFTNQIDLAMAERFDLSYVAADGSRQRPWIIHRASLGCLERTIAFLLEHYAGALPVWLAPVQVALLPITREQVPYAREIERRLHGFDLRVTLDERNESLNRKVREARLQRVPYLAVIGRKEAASGTLTVTGRKDGSQDVLAAEAFVERLLAEVLERRVG